MELSAERSACIETQRLDSDEQESTDDESGVRGGVGIGMDCDMGLLDTLVFLSS